MKLLIAGSRDFVNLKKIDEYVGKLILTENKDDITIISGGARGVDKRAEQVADLLCLPKEIYLADWNTHGSRAGIVRNEQMVQIADKVVCFYDGKSPGTRSTINFALKYKKPLEVYFE